MANNSNSVFWAIWGALTVGLIWLVTFIFEKLLAPIVRTLFGWIGDLLGMTAAGAIRSAGKTSKVKGKDREKLGISDYEGVAEFNYREAMFGKIDQGEPCIVRGEVSQINRGVATAVGLKLETTLEGDSESLIILQFGLEPEFLNGDVVTIKGTFEGLLDSSDGNRVPFIKADYYELEK